MEEAVGVGGVGLLEGGDGGAVGEEDVEEAVVVVVEDGDAAGHGLDGVTARADAVLQLEVDAGGGEDVLEGDG